MNALQNLNSLCAYIVQDTKLSVEMCSVDYKKTFWQTVHTQLTFQ